MTKRGGTVTWRFDTSDAAVAQAARRDFARRLADSGAGDDAVSRAELVFGEMLSNAARHAPGPVRVSATIDAAGCTLEVRDFGPGFRTARRSRSEELAESGRGLHLIRGFAREVRLENEVDGGARVLAELPNR